MSPVYKLSNAGGFTSMQRYTSMLAGNPAFQPSSFESIATVTVGSGGAANVEFTSIPSTYTHLQIRMIGRGSPSASEADIPIRFNSDSGSNYAYHTLQGNGSSASATALTSTNYGRFGRNSIPQANVTASVFCANVIDILDYANTNKYKTVRSLAGYDANGSGRVELLSSLWLSTSAITSIQIYSDGGNFVQYSHFALYGLRSA